MRPVPLGQSGLTVSNLALGTMQFGWTADERASFAVLDAYVEAGGNLIDSADIYSRWLPRHGGGESERIIGRWIAARAGRDRLVIATKVRGRMWPGPSGEGLSRAHLVKACEDSLRRLQVETIDLYQCHWPDDETHIEETLRAFETLTTAGKVRAIGASNHDAPHLRAALDAADAAGRPRFVSLQPHYNLVHRAEFEGELAGLCRDAGLAVLPYSPLAKGLLTGKYREGAKAGGARARSIAGYANDTAWRVVAELRQIAEEYGVAPAAIAVAWLLTRPMVTAPIAGANTPEQLGAVLPGAALSLTPDAVARLDRVSAGV